MSWKIRATVALGAAIMWVAIGVANGQSGASTSRPIATPSKPFVGPPFQYPSTGNGRTTTPKSDKPSKEAPVPRKPSTGNRPVVPSATPVERVKFKVEWYEYERDSSGKVHSYGPYTWLNYDTRRDAEDEAKTLNGEGSKATGHWKSASVKPYYPTR